MSGEVAKRRVLLVEDERVSANLCAIALESGGFAVELAASAEEALACLSQKRRFDLIVLDLYFPGTGGWELLTKVREHFTPADLPIIMLSSESNPSVRDCLLALGANDFLAKPVSPQTLLRVARQRTMGKALTASSEVSA